MSPRAKSVLVAMTAVLFCTTISFGFSYILPQGEQWLADWQLSNRSSRSIARSIVLVRAGEKSSALCGEGRWDLNVLQATLMALHQAGTSVIAPMLDVSVPVASECGGLSGFVQLAEVTKYVGSVIYPGSIPPTLAQAAVRTASLEWHLDENRSVGSMMFNPSFLFSPNVPFGAAVASLIKPRVTPPTSDSFLHVLNPMPQDEARFPNHRFTNIWKLVQAGKREELVRLFQGKVVFLYSESSRSLRPSTANVSDSAVALLHAKLANAYLTDSWVVPVPFSIAFLIAVSLGWLVMVPMLTELSLRPLGFISGIILLLVCTSFFLGFPWERPWPLFSMSLAVGLTVVGGGAWTVWQSRATVQQRIIQGQQQLMQLEYDLAGKQHHVRQLEKQLSIAQYQSNHSMTVIEELRVSQHASRSQLDTYQNEVQETRRKIERLQEELHDLRQRVPVIPAECTSGALAADDQELIQECESFQIITRDQTVLRLFHNLKKAAATQMPILLLGETGTGKEVFAKAAHALSSRKQGPFISVNMAAIRTELFEGELFGHVKGAFTGAIGRTGFLESAHGGTLFLDEVGDLPLDLQAKLLRFLEDGGFHRVGQSAMTQVDVRIVAATNRDLQDEVRAGRYREDLYYRLRSLVLILPPLRARSQTDHVLLAQSFLQQCAHSQYRKDVTFSQGALDAIVAHQWPGNIRELRQTVAQAVALANSPVITEAELNLEAPRTLKDGEIWVKADLGRQEDAMVLECLRRHKFHMQTTAATLGWDRGTVTQRLKGLGFQALMESQGDIRVAALALAGEEQLVQVVEGRLREYTKNLILSSKQYGSVEEAVADCRKRLRNLPERHFSAVEELLHKHFATP